MRKIFNITYRRSRILTNRIFNVLISRYIFRKKKVSFLIIGAQKSATTSLYYFLNKHPWCIGGIIKQINFFDNNINFPKGINWYHRQFELFNKKLLLTKNIHFFEASPEYLLERISAERIYNYNPNTKILIILRDPIKRAYSAYNMWTQYRETNAVYVWNKTNQFLNNDGKSNLKKILFDKNILPFSYWVDRELELIKQNIDYEFPYFVKRGIYADQLEVYFKQFPKENIMVIEDKKLRDDKIKTLDAVASFLSIPKIKWESIQLEDMHVRSYKASIDLKTRGKLEKFYEPHNKKLLHHNLKMSWFSK